MIIMLQLAGSDKYLTVSLWQGTTRIHIRTYFNSNGAAGGGGELIPTKKGVALTIDEWQALKAQIDHVDAMIALAEDERILRKKPITTPSTSPQSNISESYRYKPPQAEMISRQLSHMRKTTPYQQPHELEPFDQ